MLIRKKTFRRVVSISLLILVLISALIGSLAYAEDDGEYKEITSVYTGDKKTDNDDAGSDGNSSNSNSNSNTGNAGNTGNVGDNNGSSGANNSNTGNSNSSSGKGTSPWAENTNSYGCSNNEDSSNIGNNGKNGGSMTDAGYFDDFYFVDNPYDYYNNSGPTDNNKSSKVTKPTIQYLFNTDEKYAKYTDTGINAELERPIKYDWLEEFLRHIAVKGNGKLIKHKNTNMLTLSIGGRFLRFEGDKTTGKELEDAFVDSSVDVRVQKTRENGKFNLVEYLEIKKELPIVIDGKEITLLTEPKIEDSHVLLPIRSIGEGLRARVDWIDKDREAIITKFDTIIKVKPDTDIVIVNGKNHTMPKEAFLDKEKKRLLSLIGIIVKELNAKMYWDARVGALTIESNERPIKISSFITNKYEVLLRQ